MRGELGRGEGSRGGGGGRNGAEKRERDGGVRVEGGGREH